MPTILGISDLYYAIMTKDDNTGVAYQTPVKLPGLISVKIDPKMNTETLYADNGPVESASILGEVSVEIAVQDLDIATRAALLGHTVQGAILVEKATDQPPYVAIGFKAKKSNGKYRYFWLLKGRFEIPSQDNQTQEDKPKFQTPTLKGTFLARSYDGMWRKWTDEDHPNYASSIGANWFTAVESTDTTPPTLVNTTPANNATGVAVTTTIQWVFSEAILPSTVNAANFIVIKDSDGSVVTGTLSQSADKTTVIFTPSANLAAATAYRIICTSGVQDLSGNSLASAQVRKFTTA